MPILNRHIFTIGLLLAAALPAFAQGQRCKLTYYSRAASATMEVYVIDAVDVEPEFPGGENEMMKYINKHRRYPRRAYESGIEGRVLCGFVVMPNGQISDVEVIRGVEHSIDREAVRLIKSMPAWRAGTISHTPVPVYYMLPIAFRR